MYGLVYGKRVGHNGHGFIVEGSNLEFATLDEVYEFLENED